MYIQIEDIKYHVKIIGNGTPIFLLHGFAQNLESWNFLEDFLNVSKKMISIPTQNFHSSHELDNNFSKLDCYNQILQQFAFISIDLIGHGQSDKPTGIEAYGLETILTHLHSLIHKILERFRRPCKSPYIVLGYSLGGRIALHYALKYQEEMSALILESASYGMENLQEREKRRQSDFKLANKILTDAQELGEQNALLNFHDYWSNLAIFASQKRLSQKTLEHIKINRLKNSSYALAHTLKSTGQGSIPSLKKEMPLLTLPILFISGALDSKYTQIGKDCKNLCTNIQQIVLENVGHNTHLENPDLFVNTLVYFLTDLLENKVLKEHV